MTSFRIGGQDNCPQCTRQVWVHDERFDTTLDCPMRWSYLTHEMRDARNGDAVTNDHLATPCSTGYGGCGHPRNRHLMDGYCQAPECRCDRFWGSSGVALLNPPVRPSGCTEHPGEDCMCHPTRRCDSGIPTGRGDTFRCPQPAGHEGDHGQVGSSPRWAQTVTRDAQVGGDHYAKFGIQPWDIWAEYGLDAFAGTVVKYLLRAGHKGSKVEDLKKARHTLDRLIEIEEGKAGGMES